MHTPKILSAVIILFLFTSCKTDTAEDYQQENSTVYNEQYKFAATGEVSFPLDTATSLSNSNINYFSDHGNSVLCLFNSYNYELTMFDFATRQVKNKIKYTKDGENGIGPNSFGFCTTISSANNIYLLNCASHKLYLMDSSGQIKRKYDISFLRNKYNLYYNNYAQVRISGDSILYLPCYTVNYFDKGLAGIRPILKYNLKDETYECLGLYPEIYDRSTYGIGEEIRLSLAINKDQKLLFAFPRDQHLNLIVNKDSVARQFIGSKFFGRIKPFDEERLNSGERKKKSNKLRSYTRQAPFYLGLHYIEPKDAFLRIALLESDPDQSVTDDSYQRKVSFILADASMRKIGETVVGTTRELDLTYPIIIKDTIYVVNRRKYNEDDNVLPFTKFTLVPAQ